MGTTINDNESDEQIQRPVAGFNVSDIESQKYAGDWKDKWEWITESTLNWLNAYRTECARNCQPKNATSWTADA